MFPVLCDYCESSNHDACNCLYRDYVDATCASVGKTINYMTDKMTENMKKRIVEYSHYFNHSREDINLHEIDSTLGFPTPKVILYDDFEPSYQFRSNLQDVIPLPSLEQESDLRISLSQDLASHSSSPKDVTEDILIFVDPPAPFNHSCEFEVDEDLGNPSEFDLSITTYNEHNEIDGSEPVSL